MDSASESFREKAFQKILKSKRAFRLPAPATFALLLFYYFRSIDRQLSESETRIVNCRSLCALEILVPLLETSLYPNWRLCSTKLQFTQYATALRGWHTSCTIAATPQGNNGADSRGGDVFLTVE